MDESYQKAMQILNDNLDKLHLIAETLMEKETIEAEEFAELMQKVTNKPRGEDQETTKADEEVVNISEASPGEDDNIIKITYRRD